MSKRKNINDLFHQDRAVARGGRILNVDLDGNTALPPPMQTTAQVSPIKDYMLPYNGGGFERCYNTHPPLKLGEYVIYGGSCISPVVTDADIYIGFDAGMNFTQRHWPWKKGTEFLFKIPDFGVPKYPEEFHKLVKWTRKQLHDGLKIHCGCIGGHGRTGMFLAAMVKEELGVEDAITYVRENYCKKVVESQAQVKFLNEQFGITKIIGYKEDPNYLSGGKKKKSGSNKKISKPSSETTFTYLRGRSIWD